MSGLSELKVGDPCCYLRLYRGVENVFLLYVDRITPTRRIVTSDGSTWNPSGSLRGAYPRLWHTGNLQPLTQEHRDILARQGQIRRLNDTDWSSLDDESLRKIIGALNLSKEVKQ